MRAAPPVSVRCSGGWWWRGLQTGLPTAAAAASGVWALQWLQQPPGWAAAFALAIAALSWHRAVARPVDLVWDGQRWTADAVPGRLDVMLDAGGALLLRLRPDTGQRSRWIAVTAAEAGPAWHGLRVAAYQRASELPPRDAPSGPAAR
jgi:hypothetical protein